MDRLFISNIKVNKVRHLKAIDIPLSKQEMKHLIITGKNGSGKTSLLNAIAAFLATLTISEHPLDTLGLFYEKRIEDLLDGITLEMNQSPQDIRSLYEQGKFIVSYYQVDRVFMTYVPKHVEKVELKESYLIGEKPRENLIKYLLDLKMTEALAVANGKSGKAQQIRAWFQSFENLLRTIFENDFLSLEFDEDTFAFSIHMDGREPFDFNTLSSGYAAVLDIVVDLIIRMEKQTNRTFDFFLPGVVLIDEIETHLHLELQKKILKLFTTIFPNIQFIVTTHSPFILNSIDDVVIYDLENHLLVENGLTDVPYSGVVEGYFRADEMSMVLKEKYERYKELVKKQTLTDEDFDEIAELEMYLNEIPDYLALNITTEYQRLKMELSTREDI